MIQGLIVYSKIIFNSFKSLFSSNSNPDKLNTKVIVFVLNIYKKLLLILDITSLHFKTI
jgi:hypothetical protein